MHEFVVKYYLILKTVHLVSVFAWMAGLFYLPRLFVYHTENPQAHDVFIVMERRLYYIIMVPAMLLSLLTGGMLLMKAGFFGHPSRMVKVAAAFGLVILQHFLKYCMTLLAQRRSSFSSKFFRILNEVPTLLLIIIVTCVVIKPFG